MKFPKARKWRQQTCCRQKVWTSKSTINNWCSEHFWHRHRLQYKWLNSFRIIYLKQSYNLDDVVFLQLTTADFQQIFQSLFRRISFEKIELSRTIQSRDWSFNVLLWLRSSVSLMSIMWQRNGQEQLFKWQYFYHVLLAQFFNSHRHCVSISEWVKTV